MSSRRAEQTKRSKPVEKMQEWRNWQPRRLQVPVVARSCGFKSHFLHSFLFYPKSKKQKRPTPALLFFYLFFFFRKDLAPAPEKRTCKYEKIRNIKYDLLKLRIFHIQAHIIRDVSLSATFRIIIQTAAQDH